MWGIRLARFQAFPTKLKVRAFGLCQTPATHPRRVAHTFANRLSSACDSAVKPQNLTTLPKTIRCTVESSRVGDQILVQGWVTSSRRQKKWVFINLSDGTTSAPLQIILDGLEGIKPELVKKLTTGCSIQVQGQVQAHPVLQGQIEIHTNNFTLIKECPGETYPLQKKVHGTEFLREHGHLRARTSGMGAALRVRSVAEAALHGLLSDQRFTQIHTPVLTSHDCEGGGEVFEVKANGKEFFKTPAFLTVSGQLHLEMAANAISRVYTFGPTFRAEPSVTGRHLAEFWMLEAEVAFVRDLEPLLDLTEFLVSKTTEKVMQSCEDDIKLLAKLNDKLEDSALNDVVSKPFARLTYTQAIELLQSEVAKGSATFDFPPEWGKSLQSEHEQYLANMLNQPVFVTHYPKAIKPFYMKLDSCSGHQTVACFDLLLPGVGELAGGSLREDDQSILGKSLSDMGLGESYQWYLDLRRFGGAPHGGFGLGVERLIQFLTHTAHIRDTTPYPRFSGNCRY
ncbi:asparaginyl-tRNA synthetase [Entomophthora muscae]|uniref:Asparaginyl-tRNA synthetase n=1 Tax=Entomophthora muscae TaxID=34485 RepID=A0ACC2UM45_9FUNG|nr:asparaginyl-tRNA synthetase [Entomophthora muscae]